MDRRKRTEDRRQNLHLRLQVKRFILQHGRSHPNLVDRRRAIEAFLEGYDACKQDWLKDITEGCES